MFVFHFLHYKLTFDPVYAVDILNQMWDSEPVGTTSIVLTTTGLLLTLMFKLLDFCWDVYKERARQGKLQIELVAEQTEQGDMALGAIISNIGREPIVVRDVGYAKSRLLGTEFIRTVLADNPLPHALNARDLIRICISEDEADLGVLASHFRIKDSMGKIWEAPESEIRKVRRQLKVLRATLAKLNQAPAPKRVKLEELQSTAPISTQN